MIRSSTIKGLKRFVPLSLKRRINAALCKQEAIEFARYATWSMAARASGGYDAQSVLDKLLAAERQVKYGDAVFARDGVILDEPEYQLPTLTILKQLVEERGCLKVLDVGGGLGTLYRQFRTLYGASYQLDWQVAEQREVVKVSGEFRDDSLSFLEWHDELPGQFDVMVCSASLQYLEWPYELLGWAARSGIPDIILDMVSVKSGLSSDLALLQTVHEPIYEASYPCWLFAEANLPHALVDYQLKQSFDTLRFPQLEDIGGRYQGYHFQRASA